LIQEKTIALGDPVSKFVPEFSGEGKEVVTLFHLLNHSSGLPNWRPYYEAVMEEKREGYRGSPAEKQKMYKKVHEEPLQCRPGKKGVYSDIGFILLGEVVERVAGVPLHRFCYQRIFSKLPLKETYFIRLGRRPKAFRGRVFAATEKRPWGGKVIRGAVHDENAYAMGGVAGHAGLFSTANEVYLLVRLWLDSIQGNGPLDPSLATLFVTRQKGTEVPPDSTWGLGWDTPSRPNSSSGRFFSAMSFGHLGYTGTSIWVDRKRDLAVILLTNRVHPTRENKKIQQFRPELHDLIFQEVIGA
jgi:CubicO group peptidase (beta-lactamase class C family)